MADIRIKKRVTLDFLGDEYKEAYLVFYALPIDEYKVFRTTIEKLGEDDDKSQELIMSILKKNFVGGKFPTEEGVVDVGADDLGKFDLETILQAFKAYTGVIQDPKV